MTIIPSPRKACLPLAIFCTLIVGSVIGSIDAENSTEQQAILQQRRRDLSERSTPLNGHDAEVLRKLISKRVVRFSKNNDSDEEDNYRRLQPSESQDKAAPAMDTHSTSSNPFARAMKARTTKRSHGRKDRRTLKSSKSGGYDE